MEEKRTHPRSPIDLHVSCELADGRAIAGIGRDISVGGMYIEATEPSPPFGTALTIVCNLPGLDREARLPALIRWAKPSGFGIQFQLLGARETHVITKLFKA